MGGPAGLDAALHIGPVLGEITGHIVQPGDPGEGILLRTQPQPHGREDRFSLETPVAGEGDAGRIMPEIIDLIGQEAGQDGLVNAARAVGLADFGQQPGCPGRPGSDRFGRDIAPAAGGRAGAFCGFIGV